MYHAKNIRRKPIDSCEVRETLWLDLTGSHKVGQPLLYAAPMYTFRGPSRCVRSSLYPIVFDKFMLTWLKLVMIKPNKSQNCRVKASFDFLDLYYVISLGLNMQTYNCVFSLSFLQFNTWFPKILSFSLFVTLITLNICKHNEGTSWHVVFLCYPFPREAFGCTDHRGKAEQQNPHQRDATVSMF